MDNKEENLDKEFPEEQLQFKKQIEKWKIIAGFAGAAAVILGAFLALTGVIYSTNRPISVAQTAEARNTQAVQTATAQQAMLEVYAGQVRQTAEAQLAVQEALATRALGTAQADLSASEGRLLQAQQTAEAAQVAAAQATITASAEPRVAAIENFPLEVFAYAGAADPKTGWGNAFLNVRQAGDGQLAYKLDYILSEQGDAWAGMAFKFSEPQNLAPYSFLEIALLYGSQTVRLDLIFKDVNGKESRLALGPGMTYPTEVTAEGSGLSQTVHVPLGYFKDVNLEFIREITLHADSSRGRGAFNVIVEWLELLVED